MAAGALFMLDSGSAPAVCGRFARSDQYRGIVANIKQQKKRVKVAARERLENLRYRSAIKTYFRRLGVAVDAGDADAVATEHRELVRLIDRAGAKRALHPNTAARKKSNAQKLVTAGPREEVSKRKGTRKATAKVSATKNTAKSRTRAKKSA
jgi:small subunit ribosomal protein S20